MASIKAIIFDLDDTLYLERAYVFSGFAAVAADMESVFGAPADAAQRMREVFDREPRVQVFDVFLDERGLKQDASLLPRMIEVYRSHRPVIALADDADVALRRLRAHYQLGLITDGRATQQWAKIDALELRERFDRIIVTDDLGAGAAKPSPTAFETIAEGLGVTHRECVYVADNSSKDFIAPNALGWQTIQLDRVARLYKDAAAPHGGAPDVRIETLDDLEGVLR